MPCSRTAFDVNWDKGAVLVRQPDGKVFLHRKVDIEYAHKDGRKLTVSELPKHEPKAW